MPLLIHTTTTSKKEAKRLAKKLCERRLAACVQTQKIKSHYHWQGKLCIESETLIAIKTRNRLYKKVRRFLRRHHSYEVPQIVAFKTHKVDKHYQKWLKTTLNPQNSKPTTP